MVAALFILLALLQDGPDIQSVRTLSGGFARSGCWLPLKVRVAGPAGFEGDLIASADAGFRAVRAVRIPPSGTADVIIPVVMLAKDAKVDVILRGRSGDLDRQMLRESITFLDQDLLVLLDPLHPETDALRAQELALPNRRKLRFAVSDPADWNEAADMGAFEIVDVVVTEKDDLTMTVWQALGGGIVRRPRSELLDKPRDPVARFPAIDPLVARFTAPGTWIALKRGTAQLFVAIYGFAFFVVVFATRTRKGGPWMLMGSALGVAAVFTAGFAALYPKGNLALKSWQGIVDAPEAPVAISISALWGTGRADEIRFGRIVKPVYATFRDAGRRELELRRTDEGRWIVRGTEPGDPTRFVSVDRLQSLEPHRPFGGYQQGEADYYLRVGRKDGFRLQDPKTAPPPQVEAEGLVERSSARVFRVDVGRGRLN